MKYDTSLIGKKVVITEQWENTFYRFSGKVLCIQSIHTCDRAISKNCGIFKVCPGKIKFYGFEDIICCMSAKMEPDPGQVDAGHWVPDPIFREVLGNEKREYYRMLRCIEE